MPKYYNKVPFIKKSDAQWSSLNPILLDGEVILVTTEDENIRLKVGDGATRYSDLEFLSSNNNGVRMKVGDGTTRYSTLRFVSFGDEDDSEIDTEQYQQILQMLEDANIRIDSNIEISNENSQLISKLDKEVDEIQSNVNSLSEKINISTSEIAKAIVKVNEATGKIEEVINEMDEINSNIDELHSNIDSANTNIKTIETSVSDNLSQIQGLIEEISDIRSEIDSAEENITSTNESLSSLSETVSSQQSSIDNISRNYEILGEQISIVSGLSETNKTDIEELREKVNTIINSSTPDGGDGDISINLAEVIDIRNGYDGTVYETAGDAVRAIGRKVEEISMSAVSPNDFMLVRDETTGKIHIKYKDTTSEHGLLISGGVGEGNTFVLRNALKEFTFSTSYGDPCIVKYTFSSLDAMTELPTGNGTAYYYVNSNLVLSESIPQGENSFDCSKYLKEGKNEVSVTVKNADGESKSLTWEINCISIRLSSNFNYKIPYENGSITFRYTAFGEAKKYVHFILDGVEDPEIQEVESSGKVQSKTFSGLEHGVHTLEVYATSIVNNIVIKSNVLKYDILVTTQNAVDPIISINCDTTSLLQGELLSIPYIVYDPNSEESTISLDIHVLENGEYKLYTSETRVVDRVIQYWNTRNYPLGNVRFSIRLRDISRSIDVVVTEYSLPISPITNDIELYLSSASRSNFEINPAVWEYKDNKGNIISTEFNNVNWSTSGWIADENGDSTLHLTGDATAVIKYQPFSTDFMNLGKTLEFEFAIRDVNDRDANVISCMSDGVGIQITADNATLVSNEKEIVDCHFNDERRIRVTFTIESYSEYRMMSVYLDGVLTSCKQYVGSDKFHQSNPVNITIGSPKCAVDVYTVRAYNIALTQNDVITNYICDIPNIISKAETYDRNNLYDSSMNLDYAKVKQKIPVMTITGPLPQAKDDKKNVTITYEDPFDETMNFTDMSSTIDVQGTSSAGYVRKNYKIKLAEKYAHVKGGIATKTYCMKADYAEATSTHNTQIANIAHTLYYDKTPAQLHDERCRTTIQGFPCVIYHKETVDSNPYFLGKYNFNFDKGSEEAFGFTEKYVVECWEFKNNASDACNFKGNIAEKYSMEEEVNGTTIDYGWINDFERRYPDHDLIKDGDEDPEEAIARFREMHDWVVSTKSYDLNNPFVVTRYKTEFEEIFNLHKMLVYYVWTFFFLMVDQRAKNMFMTYWGAVYDEQSKTTIGGKWEPWLYDNDTCLGINNEGQLIFDYYHEDTDLMPNGTKVYNGQDSILWNKFRVAYAKEIQDTYKKLRSDKKISYEKIREQFVVNGSNKWSETIYNEDSDFKYISMLRESGDATNLPQIKGTGEHHLEYFLDGRINYCDSKWHSASYDADKITFRINTPLEYGNTKPNANITVTPFSNMYAAVAYGGSSTLQQKRLEKNKEYTFTAPTNFVLNDLETWVYGASQISSLGELCGLYTNYCDVSKATKLVELNLGTDDKTYQSKLNHLTIGTNRLLKRLNIKNCKTLTTPLELSGCPNIEEVYAEGSGITSLSLADGGYLKIVHLPDTMVNLTIKNQQYIEDFSMESYQNIKVLRIENTPNLPISDILLNTPNIDRVRLINVNWNTTEENLKIIHEKLLNCGGIDVNGTNIPNAVVTGIVEVPSIENDFLKKLNESFPELMISVGGTILCTVSYVNYNKDLLYVTTVKQGSNAPDIVAEGLIETPIRPTSDTHKYEYIGWDGGSLENIQKSTTFVAKYDVFYAVNFIANDKTLYTEYVKSGESIEDPILTGKIETPKKESTVEFDFSFDKWDTDFSNITGVTIVNAIFTKTTRSYEVFFYNEGILLEKKLVEYGKIPEYTGETPKKLNVAYPQDYKFRGWSPELGIVTGTIRYYAEFYDSDHILDSWAVISANVTNGTYKEKYPIGALQRVVLNHSNGDTEEIDMELVGYDTDTTADGKKAGLTFISRNVLKTHYEMSDNQLLNKAGWDKSEMRKYLINTILPSIPSDIRNVIVPVVKKTNTGGNNSNDVSIVESIDSIWLPSFIELMDTDNYSNSGTSMPKIYQLEGTTYELHKTTEDYEETNKKRIKYNASGKETRYWTRTPAIIWTSCYISISTNGRQLTTDVATKKQGVAFGFCIGSK